MLWLVHNTWARCDFFGSARALSSVHLKSCLHRSDKLREGVFKFQHHVAFLEADADPELEPYPHLLFCLAKWREFYLPIFCFICAGVAFIITAKVQLFQPIRESKNLTNRAFSRPWHRGRRGCKVSLRVLIDSLGSSSVLWLIGSDYFGKNERTNAGYLVHKLINLTSVSGEAGRRRSSPIWCIRHGERMKTTCSSFQLFGLL